MGCPCLNSLQSQLLDDFFQNLIFLDDQIRDIIEYKVEIIYTVKV